MTNRTNHSRAMQPLLRRPISFWMLSNTARDHNALWPKALRPCESTSPLWPVSNQEVGKPLEVIHELERTRCTMDIPGRRDF